MRCALSRTTAQPVSLDGSKFMARNHQDPILDHVTYAPRRDNIVLHFTTGILLEIPRASIEELRNLDASQLRALVPDNAGMTLSQRELDIDIYVPGLLAQTMGIQAGRVLGKKGGAVRSAAKSRAAKENGKKGGRPKINA